MKVDLIDQDYGWAAGILEGEGCFSIFQKKNKTYKTLAIHCEMTDEDTIRKLQEVLGVGNINYRKSRDDRKVSKPSWILSIQKQKDIFNTLIRVMPYLRKRRLDKAKEMFEYLEPIVVT